ncbi:7-methyl-GTP pyrophosphatase [Candidatus Magnetaquicoccaceae bacterium FCR-1]|uniref:7-methyl-GTP pyrophosphatase n=1 Tax=Candidatus Magnetaquiglobus chichijimensis TaxID=3141448 RepID=A0ABQ0C9Z8_9PROT
MSLVAPLVLASTSIYRRQLLERLGVPFTVASPETDETRLPDEPPEALVERLAEAKARAVAERFPDAVIIASDQVAVIDGRVLGKPGSPENAAAQLRLASGREVVFHNGLALLAPVEPRLQQALILFRVHFRPLREDTIQRYLERDRPFDCAGGFKSEQLGIALFSRMEGEDPTALMGLPLIALTGMLERIGMPVV